VVLLLVIAAVIPIFFKDDIQKALDEETDKYLNAQVYYDTDKFSISLFSNFPNLTVSLGDFGIVGNAPFDEDTLVSVGNFDLTIDIMSAISGDQLEIVEVILNQPSIHIIVLEDGSANYDIVKEIESETADTEEPEVSADPLSIAINHWEIIDGVFIYFDQSMQFYTTLFDLDHSGSGDFAQDVFEMVTNTTISQFSLGYEGDEYISNKSLMADITMGMDLQNMKYTFKENMVGLNEFKFGLDGFISMPTSDIDMDITFSGQEISIKSILSLIPGLYQDYLAGVTASGNVGFDGYVRGKYSENSMPQIAANLGVENGKIQYSEYPIPIENIQIKSNFNYPSADLRQTSFNVDKFSMMVDGEPFMATLAFKDLEDYYWKLTADGNIDLEKILKIVPIEDTELSGKINGKLLSEGRMSMVDNEEYEKLNTSGAITVTNFKYVSTDLPQGFGISSASASFDPQKIQLSEFKGNAGKTDLNLKGQITNYIQYALNDKALLKGQFDFGSSLVDVNEFMTASETEAVPESPSDTVPLEVVRIPENIAFNFSSNIDKLIYDNLELNSFTGNIEIKEGVMYLKNTGFDLLGGKFKMGGFYVSNTELPTYDFSFEVEKISIPSAFTSFNTVQKLAPFAENMEGNLSTEFLITGTLDSTMMPIYETITGKGFLEMAKASLQETKLVNAISSVSKLNSESTRIELNNSLVSFEIRDGKVYAEPFDLTIAGYTATIYGSNSLDGKLDYAMTVKDVSTGAVGSAVTGLVSNLSGTNSLSLDKVDFNLGISGFFNDPKVKLLGATPSGSSSGSTKAYVKEQAEQKIAEQKEKLQAEINETKEELKDSVESVIDTQKEEAKKAVDKEVDKAKEEAANAIKDLFGKKKKKKKGGE